MTIEELIEELRVRFDTSPKLYEKEDYKILVCILEMLNCWKYKMQADWNETDPESSSYIKNKLTFGDHLEVSDANVVTTTIYDEDNESVLKIVEDPRYSDNTITYIYDELMINKDDISVDSDSKLIVESGTVTDTTLYL